MKRLTSFLCGLLTMSVLCALLVFPASAAGGKWTDYTQDEWNPVFKADGENAITSAAQLAYVAKMVNSGDADYAAANYTLKNNLDLDAHEWVPIGTATHPFKGTIRGANYEITNMTINATEGAYFGLIGVGDGAALSNLTISGTITASGGAGGAAIGYAKGGTEVSSITSNVTVSVTGGTVVVGGIAGMADGAKFDGCRNAGAIAVTDGTSVTVGGLIGQVAGDTTLLGSVATDSQNSAALTVTAQAAVVGGVVGNVSAGTLALRAKTGSTEKDGAAYVQSLADLTVTASGTASVGGHIGAITGSGDCTVVDAAYANRITVSGDGDASVGGILGLHTADAKSTLKNCSFVTVGTVEEPSIEVSSTGSVYTGGIFGQSTQLVVDAPTVGGEDGEVCIVSTGSVGGVGGKSTAEDTYQNKATVAALRVAGSGSHVGGILGESNTLKGLQLAAETIAVSGSAASAHVGGVTGTNTDLLTIDKAIKIKSLTVRAEGAEARVGGIAGAADSMTLSKTITLTTASVSSLGAGETTGGVAGTVGAVKGSGTNTDVKIDTSLSVTGRSAALGGLFGKAASLSTLTLDVNALTAENTADNASIGGVAGIVGDVSSVELNTTGALSVTNTGKNSTGKSCAVGGFAGTLAGAMDDVILNATAAYTVTNTGSSCVVGGIAGEMTEDAELTDSEFWFDGTATVTHKDGSDCTIGGIAGVFSGVAVDGKLDTFGTLTVLHKTGDNGRIGGFAGQNNGTLKNVSLGDRVTVCTTGGKKDSMGGFVGENSYNGAIDFCYSAAELSASDDSLRDLSLGGMIGTNRGAVSNSYRDAAVTAEVNAPSGYAAVGGLIGTNTGTDDGTKYGTADKCYAVCDVNAEGVTGDGSLVGGLVGRLAYGHITDCYAARGTVTGNADKGTAGGLIGVNVSGAAVEHCYSAMTLAGGSKQGAFFGSYGVSGTGNIARCLCLDDGIAAVGDEKATWTEETLRAVSADALAEQDTFADWDFAETWRISKVEGRAYSYPVLLRSNTVNGVFLNYDLRWYTENPDADSFTVSDEADLAGLAMLVNDEIARYGEVSFADRTVTVGNAFHLQLAKWIPIGSAFEGTFDGGDKLVDGLRGDSLFDDLDKAATVQNVYLEALDISSESDHVGALAPTSAGTMDGVKLVLSGALSATGAGKSVGAVTGVNNGTISGTDVVVNDSITASGNNGCAGAVAGTNNGTIKGTTVTVNAAVSASGATAYAGGVAGQNRTDAVIDDTTVTLNAVVSATGSTKNYAGGVAGQNGGTIKGTGLTGNAALSAAGTTNYVGGVAGQNGGTISETTATFNEVLGATGTTDYVGGVAGQNSGTIDSNTAVTLNADLDASGTTDYVGGIAGQNSGTIDATNAELNAVLSASGTTGRAGGAVGENASAVSNVAVSGSGTVSGTGFAGGLVGELTSAGTLKTAAVQSLAVTTAEGEAGGAVGKANGTLTANQPNLQTVTVSGVSVTGTNAGTVGGAIGHANGVLAADLTLSKLSLTAGKTDADDLNVGGVVGLAEGSILRDVTAKTVSVSANSDTADVYAGGAAGKLSVSANANKTYTLTEDDKLGVYQGITGVAVSGLSLRVNDGAEAVGTKSAFVGGLVGLTEAGCVYDSSVSGALTAEGVAAIAAGGAVGQASDTYLVNNSASCGVVVSLGVDYTVGGFVGRVSGSTVRFNSAASLNRVRVNQDDTAGSAIAGGFAGSVNGSLCENSAAQSVRVTSLSTDTKVYAGGFVGQLNGTITGSYATGNCVVGTKATGYGGGFVGAMLPGSAIDSCYASGGTVDVTAVSAYSGGFAGSAVSGTEVSNCYTVDSKINATGTDTVLADLLAGESGTTFTAVYSANSSATATKEGESKVYQSGVVIWPEPETTVSLTSGTHLDGFDFDSSARVWCYRYGKNNNRPVLTALEGWDSKPDFALLRSEGLETINAANAAALGTVARLLSDDSFASLLTDGRVERGNVTVTMTGDAQLDGKLWNPIQTLKADDVLDGGNHTISGLRDEAAYGFVLNNEGTIKNLTISGVTATAAADEPPAGVVAAANSGTIENVTVTRATLTGTDLVGGVAGTNSGTIENATVTNANLSGTGVVGGVAGTNSGTITGAAVKESVTVKGTTAGGIAGVNEGKIETSETAASVLYPDAVDDTVVGGAVGTNSGALTGITSTATVKGETAGGVAGVNQDGATVQETSCEGTVTGSETAGGIVGDNQSGATVGGTTAQGDVVSNATVQAPTVGGIAGTNSGTIQNSDNIADVNNIKGGAIATGRIAGSGENETNCRPYLCAAPKAVPSQRSFTGKISVTLKTDTEGATIHYTLDGTDPTESSTEFTEAFELTDTTTVKAIALRDDYVPSEVSTFTFTKQSASGGGGGAALPTTVKVTGEEGSLEIAVKESKGTATVGEITAEQIQSVGGEAGVTIDLTGLSGNVTAVTLDSKTVSAIAASSAKQATILLPGASVTLDKAALSVLAEENESGTVRLAVCTGAEAEESMTAPQKSALKEFSQALAVDVQMADGNTSVTDFKGGSATVTVDYALEDGQSAKGVVAWYVAENGEVTEIPASYANEKASFATGHFSHYVVAYDAQRAAACPKDSTCPLTQFSDLKLTEWYHDGVHWALENGVMNGMGDARFHPDDAASRAMIAMMLWRLEGSPAASGDLAFSDVLENDWYTESIRWAASAGIITGYDGKFNPDADVTREQLATMLFRYAQYKGVDVSVGEDTNILSYADALSVSDYAVSAMQWVCGAGIVNGMERDGDLVLAPGDASSRAVVATMLMRFGKQ